MLRLAVPKLWQSRSLAARLLLPLSWLYVLAMRVRRGFYTTGLLPVARFGPPVIVVGGISVGGSGKTPVVIYVVELLLRLGYSPGIVSRGYGGNPGRMPLRVSAETPPELCGDEPAMMAARLGVPVVVDTDRSRGAKELFEALGCDLVVSDDGLQHYAMGRRVEIAVVGDDASFGNGYCLPAGPLREPPGRLGEVDIVLGDGPPGRHGVYSATAALDDFRRLGNGETRTAADFHGCRVHAVAGTGIPERFFSMLNDLGLRVEKHPFPDHHRFRPEDFSPMMDAPIVMTEKDAVKCRSMALGDAWAARLVVAPGDGFDKKLNELLEI